ncbi:MAG TPA: SGNH/GDSL hydrolase family protein, partial [Pirellulales bacterium]
ALIGDVLIEREQASGWWETALTAAHPDVNFTVRNLGWSGDTVFGHARAGFGSPADGFKELVKMVREQRPTVVVLGYGMSHSFDGEAGLASFKKGFDDLVKMLEAGDPKPRLLFLSPIRHESYVVPAAVVDAHNAQLEIYTKALREEAVARKAAFVDLFHATAPLPGGKSRPITDNGVHLTAYGYWATAPAFLSGFGRKLDGAIPTVRLTTNGGPLKVETALGARISEVSANKGDVALKGKLDRLPRGDVNGPDATPVLTVVLGSPSKDAETVVSGGRDALQVEALRQEIIHKNSLFFHRWRPQNWTYLFGFRKHEQGNNSVEIPQFDPLIEEVEKKIATLRVPQEQTYEFTLPAQR